MTRPDAPLDVLLARLATHYIAPPRASAIALIVRGDASLNRCFVLGESIDMTRLNDDIPVSSRITLTRALLIAMLDDPCGFDPRSAQSLAMGGMQIEGSARLAAYWLQLLKRPSSEGLAALARAKANAPSSIDRVPSLDASAMNDAQVRASIAGALTRSVPLVMRHAVDWPEIAWPLDAWKTREGHVVLRANPLHGAPQSVGEFIDAMIAATANSAENTNSATNSTTNSAVYTEGCLLPSAWEARFRVPFIPSYMLGAGQVWFGGRRDDVLVTPLHCDLANSFLAQVHGRKRVRLYAPAQDAAVYALDAFNTYRPCRVDVAAPDVVRFPRFADARSVDIVLTPGDLLVIPTGWFHCVWALDDVLSISRFMPDEQIGALAESLAGEGPNATPVDQAGVGKLTQFASTIQNDSTLHALNQGAE